LVGIAETDGTRHWYFDIAPSCERILGYTRDELLAMSPADIVESTPEARARARVVGKRQLVLLISDPYRCQSGSSAIDESSAGRAMCAPVSSPYERGTPSLCGCYSSSHLS
jgi:hypothetical protein